MTFREPLTEISSERTLRLLQQMLEIYSPSGKEMEVVRFLDEELIRRGLKVTRQAVDNERYNLLVFPKGEPTLWFIGHVDTVPSSDLDGFSFTRKAGKIFGLGAADMKGGCAAMIEAVTAIYHRIGERSRIGLALVVGEEENGDGAAALVNEFHFPYAVVGEPTELRPCLSHFGYLEVCAQVTGQRRHASLADSSDHPIESLLQFTMSFIQYLKMNHRELTYNLRDLTSSQAGFAVPEWAQVCIDIHLPPEMETPGDLVGKIEALHLAARNQYTDLNAQICFPTMVQGYRISKEGPFIERLQHAFADRGIPFSEESFVSHSDANLLKEAGIDPVILGPGSLLKAHAPFESVRAAEVVEAAQLYLTLGLSMSEPSLFPSIFPLLSSLIIGSQ